MALGINIAQHLKDREEKTAGIGGTLKREAIGFAKDVPMIGLRAIEGMAQSTYNLADTITGDRLPDWDNRLFGRSQSVTGSLAEGLLQWVIPATGSLKAITLVSKFGKMGRLMKPFTRVGKGGKVKTNWKGKLMAEVSADFVAFNGHEERLANLVQMVPELQNPLTEYLAAGPDDGEIEGRFKNVLEGLGLGGAVGGLMFGTAQASKLWRSGDRKGAVNVLTETRTKWAQQSRRTYSPTLELLDTRVSKSGQKAISPDRLVGDLTKYGERGVKEELKWMGIHEPKEIREVFKDVLDERGRVPVAELQKHVEDNQLLTELREIEDYDFTKYTQQAFGKQEESNYRVFVLTVKNPKEVERIRKLKAKDKRQEAYHFEEDDRYEFPKEEIITHFRVTDRIGEDKKRTLFVEELQSDWFQRLNKRRRMGEKNGKKEIPMQALEESYVRSTVRQIVRMAADEGYKNVAFPTGRDVAHLYDDWIEAAKLIKSNEDGSRVYEFTKDFSDEGDFVTKDIEVKDKEDLIDLIGKESGELLWDTMTVGDEITEIEVKTSAKPFIQQYDNAIVKELNRLGRDFGLEVQVGKGFKVPSSLPEPKEHNWIQKHVEATYKSNNKGQSLENAQFFDVSEALLYGSDELQKLVGLSYEGRGPAKRINMINALDKIYKRIGERHGLSIEDLDRVETFEDLAFYLDAELDFRPNTYEEIFKTARELKIHFAYLNESDTALHGYNLKLSDELLSNVKKNGVPLWGIQRGGKDKADIGGVITDPELLDVTGMGMAQKLPTALKRVMELRGIAHSSPEATAEFALQRLSEGGTTEEVRGLAKSLLELFGDDHEAMQTTISTVFETNGSAGSYSLTGGKTTGRIDMFTMEGSVNRGEIDADEVFKESTLLHEIVHATAIKRTPPELGINNIFTGMDYIDNLKEIAASGEYDDNINGLINSYVTAVENMPERFKKLQSVLNDIDSDVASNAMDTVSEWYGFINFDEFITESLTNKAFQNYLKTIKGSGRKTLWENILEGLKKLIGVDAKGTLLEDVVDQYSKMAHKLQKTYTPKDYGWDKRPLASRSTPKWHQQQAERRAQVIEDAFDEVKVSSTLKRGGSIALEGVTKSLTEVNTSDDVAYLLARGEKFMEENMLANPKLTDESLSSAGLHQAVDRLSEMAGTSKDVLTSEIAAAQDDANALRRIAARMYTIESFAAAQADVVFEAATAISKAGPEGVTKVMEANLIGELKKMMYLTSAGSNLRRSFGQGLQSTQIGRTKLTLDQFELKSTEIINEFMANNSGHDIKKIVNMILNEGDPSDTVARMLGIAKTARGADPKGFFDYVQNWYVNSLLSGPRTMVKNGIGNALAMTLLNVEAALGGVFTNPAITRMVMKEMFTFESFRESMNFFLKTWKNKDQLLDTGRSPLENTARTQNPAWFEGGSTEDTLKSALNWAGENIVNAPSKTLAAMDEVFKQTLFRQNVKMELTLTAMQKGLTRPDEIADYVAKGLDAVLVNNERAFSNSGVIKFAHEQVSKMNDDLVKAGQPPMKPSERGQAVKDIIERETKVRTDQLKNVQQGGLGLQNIDDIQAIADRGLEQARYGTFTNDAGVAADMAQGIVTHIPVLKLVFPFVRTPINLLKFSFDRLSFGGPEIGRQVMAKMPDLPMLKQAQQEIRVKLNSRNPIERARAHGKIALATTMNTALLYMIMSNRDLVTGGGPKSVEEKKTLQAAGWQPYSFKIGNKYFSFSGLDPIGTHIGVLVDMVDQLDANSGPNTTLASQVFAASTLSLARNVTDKSYLAGLQFLTDALSEPDRKLERAFQNIAGGFVPNILYQGQSIVGDTTVYETRNLADAIFKKLPNGQDDLDPKRNLLGEKIIREQVGLIGPFNPSAISTREGDVVFEELAALEHGFGNPNPVLDRVLDLTEFTNNKGQTAHDRRLELMGTLKLRGRNLRQAMTQTIERDSYQRLSSFSEGGFKSPRVEVLNRVLGRYRKAALAQMMEEFPELKEKYNRIQMAKKAARRGEENSAIESLLTL
jgi:hypothetical protein